MSAILEDYTKRKLKITVLQRTQANIQEDKSFRRTGHKQGKKVYCNYSEVLAKLAVVRCFLI